jgi:hypothetical protein
MNAMFSLWKYSQVIFRNLLHLNLSSFFSYKFLLNQFHGRSFCPPSHKISSWGIPNLIFHPSTFFYFLFSFIFSFFFLFPYLSRDSPILLAWPIFPPGPAHLATRVSLSSSSCANRSQDEALFPKYKPTQNRNQILKRKLKDLLSNFKNPLFKNVI